MALNHRSDKTWKSVAAGAVGGLCGSFAMNRFQGAVTDVSELVAKKERQRRGEPEPKKEEAGDDATVKAANAISNWLLNRELSAAQKKWAGPAVHYGLGISLGVVYGAMGDTTPVHSGAGTVYGSAVWLGADEMAVPALGLSRPPNRTPLSGHAQALASHLVFGLVTHLTRRAILALAK